jgi:hypothetical protein
MVAPAATATVLAAATAALKKVLVVMTRSLRKKVIRNSG